MPWVVAVDFNEILYVHEKIGSQCPAWQMENFWEALDACGFQDLGYSGCRYIWSNARKGEGKKMTRKFIGLIGRRCVGPRK